MNEMLALKSKRLWSSAGTQAWKGTLELRGLEPGQYRVFDWVNGKELGRIQGANPKLPAEFKDQLFLEVTKL